MTTKWQTYPHGADVGVRGRGPTLAAAFERAALALTATVTAPGGVRPARTVAIACEARDPEMLLYAWLNAVIYEMASRGMLFGRYSVRIDGARLDAEAAGETVDRQRHRPAVEPKGATLTDLAVTRTPEGDWIAQCVVDV